jgi:tetratricopeptide (TPR) repeat protein
MKESTPLCLVLMPFDKKNDATGRVIDFEAVYQRLVVPAVEAAGLTPMRAEEQRAGGVLDKRLFERLIMCEYAVADLTTANANVFYQLGVRHCARLQATVPIYAAGTAQLPLDVHQLEAVPYRVSPQGLPVYEAKYRTLITEHLKRIREGGADSPLYRLVPGYPEIDPRRIETMGEQQQYLCAMKKQLAEARLKGGESVRELEWRIRSVGEPDCTLLLDIFFCYRAVKWWNEMIEQARQMPPALAATAVVQEQLALALHAAGRSEEAEQALRELIAGRGPSSESYTVLGRILKDRWEKAVEQGDKALAKEFLEKAIAAYHKGFEADWRDTNPGVNVVVLMELKQPADPRRRQILPVVYYALEQRVRSGAADYWDYATLLELAVLSLDEAKGMDALGRSLARVRESWEAETTARDLRLIREARHRRGADSPAWAEQAESELLQAAARGTARP